MNRRSFFKWATATGCALFLPSNLRPTRQWKFVEESTAWRWFEDQAGHGFWLGRNPTGPDNWTQASNKGYDPKLTFFYFGLQPEPVSPPWDNNGELTPIYRRRPVLISTDREATSLNTIMVLDGGRR